jgi:[ribosomal protein S5]-alanine N-acetyltransferase
VQRHLGGAWPPEEMARRLRRFVDEHAARGHSKWKVSLHDGTFIGRAGISYWAPTGELELGYALRRPCWGSGIATEAGRAVAAWTFANLEVDHIIGFTDLENAASQRVLEKIGMVRQADRDIGAGGVSAVFRMERP